MSVYRRYCNSECCLDTNLAQEAEIIKLRKSIRIQLQFDDP